MIWNLLIVADLWEHLYQILLIIFQKNFVENVLNVEIDAQIVKVLIKKSKDKTCNNETKCVFRDYESNECECSNICERCKVTFWNFKCYFDYAEIKNKNLVYGLSCGKCY